MESAYYFGYMSLWGFFVATIFCAFLAIEIGYRWGQSVVKRASGVSVSRPIESFIGAELGLLAFVLAFTFNMALSHYDQRRHAVLDEANAIGTTYLRAGYLAEPYQTNIRTLLKEYVALHLKVLNKQVREYALKQIDIVQKKMWDQILLLVDAGHKTPADCLAIQSLNEVIDLHAKRLLLLNGMRIPGVIWIGLLFVFLTSMGVLGYISGLKSSRSIIVNLSLTVAFATILFLIVDLDYPQEGYVSVSQQPLIDLQKTLVSDTAQ